MTAFYGCRQYDQFFNCYKEKLRLKELYLKNMEIKSNEKWIFQLSDREILNANMDRKGIWGKSLLGREFLKLGFYKITFLQL